jgi:histidine triad (HIT) family protein
MSDCIFCEISNRQSPASFVYEDEQVFGIVSSDQPNPYKILIIPHAHVETVTIYPKLKRLVFFKRQ